MINLLRLRSWLDRPTSDDRVRTGRDDEAIFQDLVEAHYRRIYNLCLRMVRKEGDAADLTQEAFVRVYRHLPRLRAEAAGYAWVRRIATNTCLDHIRRRKSAPPTTSLDTPISSDPDSSSLEVPDAAADPYRICASRERSDVLHAAIDRLPEDYRTVIMLHHIEEMRVDEIGEIVGIPVGTVKSRLSRARRALFLQLADYFGAEPPQSS